MFWMIKVPYWLRNPIASRGSTFFHENALLALIDPFLLVITLRQLLDAEYDWWTEDPIRKHSPNGDLTGYCVFEWVTTFIVRTLFAPISWLMSFFVIFMTIGSMIVDNPILLPIRPIIYLIGIISGIRLVFRSLQNFSAPVRDLQAESFFKFYNSPELRSGLLQDIRDKKVNWQYPESWKIKLKGF